jgi:diacylglycerol kinase (ATP)
MFKFSVARSTTGATAVQYSNRIRVSCSLHPLELLMRLLLVFNPHAAAGRASRLMAPLRAALDSFASVDLWQTSGPGDAVGMLAGADLAPYDGVVAAGGDGTLFEVLNGLYARQAGERPPLGVMPVGTGNAFARDLGLLPGDWQKAAELIGQGRVRRVDVGRVDAADDTYHFLNIVGAGLPVDAMAIANRLKLLGNSAYSLATLWHAMKLRTHQLQIELDGDRLGQESLFVEVSNTRYTGTSFMIAPAARLDDGLLDLTLVSRLSRPRLLRLFPTVYRGRHVDYPEVVTRQARVIRITAPAGLELAPDGELRGHMPVQIECLHRDLRIFGA